eukprot:g17278.t1
MGTLCACYTPIEQGASNCWFISQGNGLLAVNCQSSGAEFWTSSLNVREPPEVEECGEGSPQETGPPESPLLLLRGPLRTRCPGEVGNASQSGALSFVNPLFESRCKGRRGHFKSSVK